MKYERMNIESMELCKLDELDEYIRKEKNNKIIEEIKGNIIVDKRNMKEKTELINNRVNVWFNDKNKYFRGRIIKDIGDDKYQVLYEDKREGVEEVELKMINMTRERNNTERWNIIR
jgi:hypothetical protein